MLTEPTLDRLRALRLGAMADAYRTQLQDPAIGALSFDERVGLLVDAEHLSRDNRKLGRRLKEAKQSIKEISSAHEAAEADSSKKEQVKNAYARLEEWLEHTANEMKEAKDNKENLQAKGQRNTETGTRNQ